MMSLKLYETIIVLCLATLLHFTDYVIVTEYF